MSNTQNVEWQLDEVVSPHIDKPVTVIAAKNIPYIPHANRLQNLSIYIPATPETSELIGTVIKSIPSSHPQSRLPQWHVHIHGGAWRDPYLSSASIEADVAHAFSTPDTPISAIASINYTLSPFPTHPKLPYDPSKGDHSDPAREAVHPMHVNDVLHAFALLRSFGLTDDSYILTGHSCGSCLAFQSTLQPPSHWGFDSLSAPPRPAAQCGFNGLYDLPDLVHNLGTSHANLKDVYENLQSIAFGPDQSKWPAASPARVDSEGLAERAKEGNAPKLVLLDQSSEDQLVPMNQTDKLEKRLREVHGMKVVRGKRCTGRHAAPWEEGIMIWESILDVLKMLKDGT